MRLRAYAGPLPVASLCRSGSSALTVLQFLKHRSSLTVQAASEVHWEEATPLIARYFQIEHPGNCKCVLS